MSSKMVSFRSNRASSLTVSASAATANTLLNTIHDAGTRYPMFDGELDLAPSEHVIEATQRALADGHTRYDLIRGLLPLRERLSEIVSCEFENSGPDSILVSNGSSQAIFQAVQCFVNPGDHVLYPCPAWPSYTQFIAMAEGIGRPYVCNNSGLDIDEMERLFEFKPRMVIINSPHNPTGACLSELDISAVADLCESHNTIMLIDAAYEDFHFSRDRHNFSGLHNRMMDNLIVTRSFSKSHAMTGYRVGYVASTASNIDIFAAMQSHVSDNVALFSQFGAYAALTNRRRDLSKRRSIIRTRSNTAFDAVSDFMCCERPSGGFFLLPRLPDEALARWPKTADFVSELSRETGVQVAAGEPFGAPHHIRLSIASLSEDRIIDAVSRLRQFVSDV